MIVLGRIDMQGQVCSTTLGCAPGSGGSIYIQVTNVGYSGSGTLTVNGGAGSFGTTGEFQGAGGGGGRIAIIARTIVGTGPKTAFGGSGYSAGGPGTVYTRATDSQTYGYFIYYLLLCFSLLLICF